MTDWEWFRTFGENSGVLYRVRGDGGSCGVAFLPHKQRKYLPFGQHGCEYLPSWEVRVLTHAGHPLRRQLTFRGVISQDVAECMVEELAAERATTSLNTWVAC